MVSGTDQIISQLGALSYAGIWLTSFLANVVIPIPEEAILLVLGYLVGTSSINGMLVIPIVISGLLLSDLVIYTLSKNSNRFILWFYNKFFAKKLMLKGDNWVDTNMVKIIIFSRFLIQLRFLGPFIAGQKKLPWKKFIVYDLFALVIYVSVYILLGVYFQSKVKMIVEKVGVVRNIILIVIGFLLLFGLARFAYKWLIKRQPK